MLYSRVAAGRDLSSRLLTRLQSAVENDTTPSAVLVVGDTDSVWVQLALGLDSEGGRPVTIETRYDLASLTKVVSCLPALLTLVDAGEIRVTDRLRRFFSDAGGHQVPSLGDTTILELMTHTSGLPAWRPLFAWVSTRATAVANVLQSGLEHEAGTNCYSDLGVIALGAVVETVTAERLDTFVNREVFGRLGMGDTRYGPLPNRTPVAATEFCGWRGRLLQGEVHDKNAYVMEGVSGHAGLFSTATDILNYGRAWLTLDERLGREETLQQALRDQSGGTVPRHGWLWQLGDPAASCGALASASAFGHTGFTGTSLWVDPEQKWVSVLLTNRVHPHRDAHTGIEQLRKDIHEIVSGSRAARRQRGQ